jgi:hypothetical protein
MKHLGFVLVTLLLSVDCVAQSDFCQTMNAAMRALPVGGVVDETSATGTQTCFSDPFANVNVPVTLLLGHITITSTESWTIPSNVLIRGASRTATVVSFQPTSPTNNFLLISGPNVDLGYFAVIGRDTGRFVAVNGVSNVHIHDLYVSGTSSPPTNGPMAGIYAVGNDIWIENNILSGNGPATSPPDLQSYDIVAWRNPSRIHIRNNQISNSNTGQSITCFNCQDSDAIGNQVNQNNRMPSPITGGGYGIMFYASTGITEAARIEHNHVTNTAGSGIYCATCSHTSIANNTVAHVAQQQSDDVEPVGCVSVNGFDHGSVTGNVCDGSVKDCFVIDTGGAGNNGVSGSVFSGNTAHFCGGNGFSLRSTVPLTNLVVTGNSVELVNGTNGYGFNIYLVSLVQSLILTNNIAIAPPGRSYNLGDRCLRCIVANNL